LTDQTARKRTGSLVKGVVLAAVAAVALLFIPLARSASGQDWGSNTMVAVYILSGCIIAAELAAIVVLRTARTRYTVERKILAHREVNEYVILWNRPRWILYMPTMAVSLVFGVLLVLRHHGLAPQALSPGMLGGVWVVVAILNVLVEQLHMTIRTVLILVPTLAAVLLALHLVGRADEAVRLLRYSAVNVPPKLYFLTALTIALVNFIGWVHGLFHYMAVTPNMADLQRGLTETGKQIKNSDYDVDFDATDVVERWLFGFGRIIVTLDDPNRPAMVFFVPHAAKVDERLRRVRSVTAIDRPNGPDAV
jgi:uncharacterized membrane protein YciS (DUF1049 family)